VQDEIDYLQQDRQDLIARLMGAQALNQFLLRAYSALRSYGVDFMKLPEWQDQRDIDHARTLKPRAGQELIIAYMAKLENALSAAIRRSQLKLHRFDAKLD